jgi:hypothetical protein
MQVGNDALEVIKRFHSSAPGRFATYAWMDWTDLNAAGFFSRCAERLEQMVEHGACGLKIWKDLGTSLKDSTGELLRVDDERLAPIFEKAAELSVPVMFHIADPDAFFQPIDERNERYEELAAHPEWSFHSAHFGKQELLQQRDRVFARHPRTTFVAAHVAERAEDLSYVSGLLERYPNVLIDISARSAELGRQPYAAREFFRTATASCLARTWFPTSACIACNFRFLETADGNWNKSHASPAMEHRGLFPPDDVLGAHRETRCYAPDKGQPQSLITGCYDRRHPPSRLPQPRGRQGRGRLAGHSPQA